MNSIDFLKYTEFPVSAETYNFMQDMIALVAKLSSIAGNNCILSGCIDAGSTVSSGYVVINGEILPFAGGAKSTYVIVEETKTDVQVLEQNYQGLYTSRMAKFGAGTGQIAWSSFTRITDILSLAASVTTLNGNFQNHLSNHTVEWAKVLSKPSVYPPATHTHQYAEIDGIPSVKVRYYGYVSDIGALEKRYGDLTVDVTKISTGKYRIQHSIGHSMYYFNGVGINIPVAKAITVADRQHDYCDVITGVGGTLSDTYFEFIIITF